MGIKTIHDADWSFSSINGTIMTRDGKIKQCPIKLTGFSYSSNELLEDVAYRSDSMEDVCERILSGEETGWTLKEVVVQPTTALLLFDSPVGTGTDKYYNFIEFFYGNGIELQFEIGRGRGIAPDRFHISGTSLTGAKYSGDFYPKIVEILEGGALRRTTEYDFEKQRYEITEERF